MTKTIIFERLKELLSEVERKDPRDLEAKLESCWEECWVKERDSELPPELILENKRILQEIAIAIETYQAGIIDTKKLQKIKTSLIEKTL
ncbi:MAG: hypothetical protein QW261_12980 [Candidatus Jordarchaeaceae archaeon]